jgi:hypothetical protein
LVVVLVSLAVLAGTVEAKLSMYLPDYAPGADTWKVIKVQEQRKAVSAVPLQSPLLSLTPVADSFDPRWPILAEVRVAPGSGPSISQSHWFRPPPVP